MRCGSSGPRSLRSVAACERIPLHQNGVWWHHSIYNRVFTRWCNYLVHKTKRVRSDPEGKMDNDGKEGTDRLSNFMTVGKLEGRAIRSIALRTLFLDRSTDHAFTKSSFSRAFETSKLDIEELFRNGYYRCGLLLAKAWSKNREVLTGSSRPGGHDLFYDSLSHLLYAYLIPLSIQPASKSFRPSSNQLHAALDDFGAKNDPTLACRCCHHHGHEMCPPLRLRIAKPILASSLGHQPQSILLDLVLL